MIGKLFLKCKAGKREVRKKLELVKRISTLFKFNTVNYIAHTSSIFTQNIQSSNVNEILLKNIPNM